MSRDRKGRGAKLRNRMKYLTRLSERETDPYRKRVLQRRIRQLKLIEQVQEQLKGEIDANP